MKKLLPILAVALMIITTACKKNTANGPATIVGKWLITADTSYQIQNGKIISSYVIVGENSPYYQFNSDGTGTSKYNLVGDVDNISTFTYTYTNNTLTMNTPAQHNNSANNSTGVTQVFTSTQLKIYYHTPQPPNGGSEYKEYLYLTRIQ